MIKNMWYAVLESKEVKEGRPLGATRLGERLVFFRGKRQEPVCLADQCAHRGAALSLGKVEDGEVACPFHGLRYDPTGRCTLIPSRGRGAKVPENFAQRRYPTREAHGMLWIWWGEERADYPELPFFANIDESFDYGTHVCHWRTHYSRAIENQLDVAHLPFVHYNTIGRGRQFVCDGPYTELAGDDLTAWVANRLDDGIPSRLPDELQKPSGGVALHFKFPNVWQLNLQMNSKVVAFFVPVDEENTLIYLRFYHKFTNVRLINRLISLSSMFFNNKILHQDRAVVNSQIPKRSDFKMGENLFPADRPIILYRKRRAELLAQQA